MNIKDGNCTRRSSNSCNDSDLEQREASIYSMLCRDSKTYDVGLSSTAVHGNSAARTNPPGSVPGVVVDVEPPPNPTNNVQERFHNFSKGKRSQWVQGREYLRNFAGTPRPFTNQERVEAASARNCRLDARNRMKKQSAERVADVPKTASLCFRNLTRSLNNVQYLKSVETPKEKPSGGNKKAASSLVNFTFAEMGVRNKAPGAVPVFRLDDRLFPNVPRNTSKEEFELSHRLFSNQGTEVALDRHSHRFSQLPTVPLAPLLPPPMKRNKTLKNKRKRMERAKRKAAVAPPAPVAPQPDVSVVLPVIGLITNLNSLLRQGPSDVVDLGDDPVEVSIDIKEVINLEPAIDVAEIINLDSDSDSADSILVITPPCRTPPPLIALSDEEDAPPLHPVLENHHAENSFDFLDSSDEPDGLSKSQVSVFAHLMANSGSKESLLDDRLFHRLTECGVGVSLQPCDATNQQLDQVPKVDSSVSIDTPVPVKQPSSSIVPSTLLQKQQVSKVDSAQQQVGKIDSVADSTVRQKQQVGKVDNVKQQVGKVDSSKQQVGKVDSVADSTVRQKQQVGKVDSAKQQVGKVDNAKQQVGKVDNSKQQVGKIDSVVGSTVRQKQQVGKVDTAADSTARQKQQAAHPSVVDVDESSGSVETVDSASSPGGDMDVGDVETGSIVLNVLDNSETDAILNRALEEPGGKRKRGRHDEGARPSPKKGAARKKRGKKAREKSRHQLQEFLQNRSGMGRLPYTKIEGDYTVGRDELRPRHPAKWTRDMRRYYRDSWGGENFDVQAVQRTMSADQSLWRITWEDRRGPAPTQGPYRRVRCYNCNRFGHPEHGCPEPHRVAKCHMCGERGHREPACPNKICLQCMRPAAKFSNGCWECQHIPHPLCTKCVWKHDPAVPCTDNGRNPTTPEAAPDLRERLESKRSRFGNRSLDSGVRQNIDNGRKSRDSYSPHGYGGPPAYRKHAHRRSRP